MSSLGLNDILQARRHLHGIIRKTPFEKSAALADAKTSGRVCIPSFDDLTIMAGHGTMGLEMLEEIPGLDAMIVPVGGKGDWK